MIPQEKLAEFKRLWDEAYKESAKTIFVAGPAKPINCWSCGHPMEYHVCCSAWWCASPKCETYRYTDQDRAKDTGED